MTAGGEKTPGLRVGLTGHRLDRLSATNLGTIADAIGALFDHMLAGLHEAEAESLTLVSGIAEGADRLAAHAALARPMRLECALPFATDEYENDFDSSTSRREYRALLDAADAIVELPGTRADEVGAYAGLGGYLVQSCQALIAVWNGEPPRGPGGTGDVVEKASAVMPVLWIASTPPHSVQLFAPGEEVAPFPTDPVEARAVIAGLIGRSGGGDPAV